MKAGFGLIALLIAVGLLMYLQGKNAETVVNTSKPAIREAERIAGVDETGMRVQDSITLDPFVANGKVKYVLVEDIVAGGPMEKHFGLKKMDQILRVGPLDMSDQDSAFAKALIYEARARNQEMLIRRDGAEMTLPLDEKAQAAAADAAAKQQLEGYKPRDNRTGLQRQLDNISGSQERIPKH